MRGRWVEVVVPARVGEREIQKRRGGTSRASGQMKEEQMADDNLVLVVGSYPDRGDASADFRTLREGNAAGRYDVLGAVVVSRDASSEVGVDERGTGPVARGAGIGAVVGVAVGLLTPPPLLLATALGAGIGAGIGALVDSREETGVDVEAIVAPGTSAVVAVVGAESADSVERTLVTASKRIRQPIDPRDYTTLRRAWAKYSGQVSAAILPSPLSFG
jgi:uncharacterized membrane protein